MHEQATHQTPPSESPAAASATPPTQAAPPAGHDVLKIIADVEGHLSRLRSAQRQQDDVLGTLTARAKALRIAEEDLDRQRVALKQQTMQVERDRAQTQQEREQFAEQCRRIDEDLRRRASEVDQAQQKLERERAEAASHLEQAARGKAELEQARGVWDQTRQQIEEQLNRSQAEIAQRMSECAKAKDEIASARSQWEKQRQESQGKIDARSLELDQQLAALAQREAALQQERERLALETQQAKRQHQELQNRAAALESERADLLNRVEQAERNVGELIHQVETTQQELIDQTRLVKSAMEKVGQMQQRERSLEKSLEQAKAAAQQAERDAQDLLHIADSERGELQAKIEAAQKAIEEAHQARDAAIAELETTRKKVVSMQRDLKSRDDELATRDAHLADLQKKLDMASGKLSEFAQVLSEQTPQLERGAAALAMCEEQAEQIDRLTSQLAELQLSSDPAEVQRRDERIAELTEALRQARGQNAGEAIVAELEQRNASLQQEVQQLRLETQNAQIAAEEARRQLQESVNSGAEAQVKDVALVEHAAKIAALSAELERVNAAAATELEQKLTAQSRRHQQELASAREQEQSLQPLRQRIADLEAQLARAKAEKATAQAAGNEGESDYVARLRAKAEQITNVAEHLRRRRSRLEHMRLLMRRKRREMPNAGEQGSAQHRADQLGQIERERQHLLEVRKMLAASEFTMIRRWARQRAAFTAACVALIIAVSAGATWLAVNHFYPAVRSVSAALEARSRPGAGALTDEQVQLWTDWHAEAVNDAGFQQTLAKRMAERRLEQWSRPESLSVIIRRDLSVDANDPGLVLYTMTGTDSEQMAMFLDVLTYTLLTESNRDATRRGDSALTMATGERKEEGRVRFASVNAAPVRDERMQRALPIFGGTLGGLMLLSLISYIKLSRSRRQFEEENGALFQDIRSTAVPAA